jgi:uncharacterized secreted repeat protein (TIGR03808 family)
MLTRRNLLYAALAAPAFWRGDAARAEAGDATASLQRAIDDAQRTGRVVVIPPGVNRVSRLKISGDVRLVGGGVSRIIASGPSPLLTIERAQSVSIENVIFDGGDAPSDQTSLIEARDVADLHFADCAITRGPGYGLRLERCGGRIERSSFQNLAQSALQSIDATGLTIADNRVAHCGANGLQVWRSAPGYDGSIIKGNRVERIRADPGGDGPYGNAISIFRAGNVICTDNVLREAAFSAIRCNSGADVLIANNSCFDIGETALYVEFAFQGAVVSSNLVDGASTGVSVTNFDQGGRLASVTGNTLRNLIKPLPQGGEIFGVGIHVEADTAVSGNVVDNARFVGLSLGYGVGLRDVVATGNALGDCGYGIVASVAPGAGAASIRDNRIVRARRGAIVGMAWEKVVSADLLAEAEKYPLITMAGNDVR